MIDALRRSSDAVRWYVGAVMGDSHYQRYLAHHRTHHPSEEAMTEGDYWRTRYRDQDRNPQGRCC